MPAAQEDLQEDLMVVVEQWDDNEQRVERVLARSCNVTIARGAYEAAVKLYPNRSICMRQGIRVIAQQPARRVGQCTEPPR